jgi:heterodisulfide reductase subunit C
MENIKTNKMTEFTEDLTDLLRDAGYLEIDACIQCGTCTGGCPSGRRTAYRTRSLMRKTQLGLTDEVLSDKELWFCSTCYTCLERCPRGVPVTDVIIFLRNLAVQKGYIQAPHLALCKMFYNTGHGVPINNGKWNKLREHYKLSSVPPTTHQFSDAEQEVQSILKSTGFDKLTGVGDYEKEKKNEEG